MPPRIGRGTAAGPGGCRAPRPPGRGPRSIFTERAGRLGGPPGAGSPVRGKSGVCGGTVVVGAAAAVVGGAASRLAVPVEHEAVATTVVATSAVMVRRLVPRVGASP